jgi:hypothetical protein
VAAQLTRRNWRTALKSDTPVLRVPAKQLIASGIAAIVVTYAAMGAGIYAAARDRDAAERQQADLLTLLESPPASMDELTTRRDEAQRALDGAKELLAPAVHDPASDEATAMLVEAALAQGLDVRGVERVAPSAGTVGEKKYDVRALRVTVAGHPGPIAAYVAQLQAEDPGLIPSLTSMDVDESGVATAEILFAAYAPAATATAATAGAGAR